jgi:hypothetical protein
MSFLVCDLLFFYFWSAPTKLITITNNLARYLRPSPRFLFIISLGDKRFTHMKIFQLKRKEVLLMNSPEISSTPSSARPPYSMA